MARKLQKLINYHTSGTGMPASGDVALGEIVVRHNNEKPELLIEKTNGTFATFIDSGAVENAIAVAQTTVEGQVSSLSGSVDTKFSNYYTKAEVNNNVATAKSEAVSSAKGYTDGKITELDGKLSGQITTVDGRVTTLNNSFTAFQGTVANTYATKTGVTEDIKTAKDEAIGAASAYTDSEISELDGKLSREIETVDAHVETVSASVKTFSASVVSNYATKDAASGYAVNAKTEAVAAAKTYTDDEVEEAKSALTQSINTVDAHVDTVSGSVKAFSATVVNNYATKSVASGYAVNAKTEAVDAAKTYTDSKVDGINSGLTADITGVEKKVDTLIGSDSGKTARSIAAEEVAKVVANADADFDTLKEIADWIQNDTTGAAKMANDIEDLKEADTALTQSINTVDAHVTTVSGSVKAFSATVVNDYATKVAASGYAVNAKTEAVAAAKTYTDDEVEEAKSALTQSINTVDAHVTTVSASVKTFSASVVSNYATKTVASGYAVTAKSEAVSSAKGYTDGKITELDSALTADITALDGRIDKLESLTATTNSAIQEIKVSGITGVDVVANGTTRTLDFTDMVIDCGDF